MTDRPQPSADELAAFLDCCRFGDVEQDDLGDIQRFAAHYGDEWLAKARDDRGNTALHMAGGNGHTDIVQWLLPRLPESALVAQNDALSTPLHWIALNYHLPTLQLLCPRLPLSAFEIKNQHGKTAVQEAEEACEAFVVEEADQETDKGRERVRREKCVAYVLGCMGLGVKKPTGGDESKAEEAEGEVKAEKGEEDDAVKRLTVQAEQIKLEQEAKAKQA
ncbi:ankyrin repeat containing protein [Rhodotorula toruloides]|uniref:Ankyrin repeat containing protein n=1 Tax=Rhodotorula toruloides TaxID=5286 RepID=A0A511KBC6_RHOTO|nr:ankyrin repeat containing protein [Rhodotorula toruloides]